MTYQPKSYRKFVATAATATLVATAFAPFASAHSFKDVETKYEEAVNFLVSKGVSGYADGTFKTQKTITRIEAAEMLGKALGLDKVTDAPASGFTDVPERVVTLINAFKAKGITTGKTATTFAPNAEITRGELAVWIQKAYDLKAKEGSTNKFTDVADNYKAAVQALVDNKITSGTSETTFGTTESAKRGDFALFVKKAADAAVVKEVAVESVSAINGTVTVTLKEKAEKVDVKDFKVTQAINGAAAKEVTPSKAVLAEDGKTVTLTVAEVAQTDAEQSVVYTVNKVAAKAFVVEAKEAQVESVTAINARTLEVKFNQAIKSDDTNLKKVVVTKRTDAVDPGTLTYKLSKDGKLLTISTDAASDKYFSGNYSVVIGFEQLETTNGGFIKTYNSDIKVTDNVAPTFTTEKLSASVYKVKFSEPMRKNIASTISFKDKNGASITVGSGNDQINVTANNTYTELTLTIGSSIVANENITATIIGALDASGNLMNPNPATFTFQKGAPDGVKPVVSTITQTGAKNFTIKFSEELIQNPTVEVGTVLTSLNSASVKQDETDKTLYHVEATSVLETGNYYVKVSAFTDLSGEAGTDYTTVKSFVKDLAAPTVTSYKLVKDATDNAEYLELTFDKDVTEGKVASSGTAVKNYITKTLTGSTGKSVTLKDASESKKVVRVKVADILAESGDNIEGATYNVKLTFTDVKSATEVTAKAVDVSFTRGNDQANTTEKVKVTTVEQGDNNDTVVVTFDKDIDAATATVASNYHISGAVVKSATVKAGETKKVYLTLEKNSNTFSGVRNATISGVKVKDTDNVMDTQTIVTGELKENVAPTVLAVKYDIATETFKFTFSEAVKQENTNALDFEVYLDGSAVASPIKFDAGAGSSVATTSTSGVVKLTSEQVLKTITLVGLDTIDLVDEAGNAISVPSAISVSK